MFRGIAALPHGTEATVPTSNAPRTCTGSLLNDPTDRWCFLKGVLRIGNTDNRKRPLAAIHLAITLKAVSP